MDTGASNHMCFNINLLTKISKISDIRPVCLPGGSIKVVTHTSDVTLNDKIVLKDVLYVPSFKYNVLSNNKLAETCLLRAIFFSHC